MIAVERSGARKQPARSIMRYLPLLFFFPLATFFAAGLLAVLAAFLGDFFAGLTADFLEDDAPPEKILSQLSEYCLVAPTRRTLMVALDP